MNRFKAFVALILCALTFAGCTGKTDAQTTADGTAAQTADTAATEYVPPEPEVEARIPYDCKPVYREKVTEKSGVARYGGKVRLELEYTSKFYGHDSLINRDFIRYGYRFEHSTCQTLPELTGELAGADFNGDGFAELLHFSGGTLSFYSFVMKLKKTVVYNAAPHTTFSAEKTGEISVGVGVSLRGAGDFNGDGYNDILFTSEGYAVIYYGGENGFECGKYRFDPEGVVRCGDADGDGVCDVFDIGEKVRTYTVRDGRLEKTTEGAPEQKPEGDIIGVYAADVNSDGLCDIAYAAKSGGKAHICSYFNRGDGRFGAYAEDNGNKNLYGVFVTDRIPVNVSMADMTGDGSADLIGAFERSGSVKCGVLFSYDEPAYDYSVFGMRVNGEYRVYSGCRWYDSNYESSDGDHVMLTTSKDGKTWRRYIDAPMFMLGWELGEEGWWTSNTLEPEVVYADGKYHMYWQCSFTTPKGNYGDKIGYAYSDDGVHWTRKTDEPAIVSDDPEVGFNHEEILYVPDDPDGKPYWMYTGHFVNGVFRGYIRIRSSVPDRFLYSDKEATDGFSQIGNQLAYFTDDSGRRVFVRITFTDYTEVDGEKYWRPVLFLSDDGLRFTSGTDWELAGVDVTDPRTADNRQMFFLGMVTENGTGEIPRNEDGTYTLVYLATTCASSVAPQIFSAEVGYGEMIFKPVKK